MSVAVILGDVHLGKGLTIGKPGIGSALNSRVVDQLNILEWTLTQAIESMASVIIITGDIFEDSNKPHPTLIALFMSWLVKCTKNNIDVHIVAGNHDILRSGQFYMSALDVISAADIDGVHIYTRISTLHIQGASFTLVPYRDRRSFNTDSNIEALKLLQEKFPYEISEIDRANAKIVIGHLAIEGSIFVGDEVDDMSNELFCPVDFFNGYDYVWMGHVHKPQVMSKHPFVAHIGSMDISDFTESDHKKIIIIFDPEAKSPYKYLEIPTRPLNQISISVPDDIIDTTSYVIGEIKQNLSKAMIRLNITFNNPDLANVDRTKVETHLNGLGAFHICRINEEKRISSIKKNTAIENMDNTVNEITAIKMFADSNINEDIRNDFITLANSVVKECSDAKDSK